MIKPLPGYLLIEPIEEESVSAGGVYVPESSKDKPSKGKIVSIGTPTKEWLDKSAYDIAFGAEIVGTTVIYKKWTNQEIKYEGKTYLLVKFDELLATID